MGLGSINGAAPEPECAEVEGVIRMWVLYDIPNEHVMFCELDYMPTEEQSRANIIKMPYGQAAYIRRAKNLPMPMPPVEVEVGHQNTDTREGTANEEKTEIRTRE